MTVLYVLGAIGGILAGIDTVIGYSRLFKHWYRKYEKMKNCYERHKNKDEKLPMGFMTEKERSEIEDRLTAKKGS